MKRFKLTLLSLFIWAAAAAQQTDLKVLSYNLRFGELASMEQFGEYIAQYDADLVALQECDWATYRERAPRQNGVKFMNELASRTGMFGLYGKAMDYKQGYYGIGLLSRYPIVASERVQLPRHKSTEQRVMLVADVELPDGTIVTFASVHLEVASSANRLEQAAFINKYFRKAAHPVFLAGDMNARPGSPEMEALLKAGWQSLTNEELTYSTSNPEMKIDYIYYLGGKKAELRSTRVCRESKLSDHFPVVSEVSVELKARK